MGHHGPDARMGPGDGRAGLKRQPEVETLRGAKKLNRQDVFEIPDNLAQLERAGHAHGDMILFASRRGDGVGAAGVGENLAFVEQRGGGDMGDHVARRQARLSAEKRRQPLVDVGIDEPVDAALTDAGEIRECDGGIIEGIGQGCAVEVSSG